MELSRQWDSDELLGLRHRVNELARTSPDGNDYDRPGPDALRSSIEALAERYDPEYGKLLKQPNWLEDIAILVKHNGIDFSIVNDSLGYNVAYTWSLWKPTVDWLREESNPLIYTEFEALAKQIARVDEHVKIRDDGEIVWEGFMK